MNKTPQRVYPPSLATRKLAIALKTLSGYEIADLLKCTQAAISNYSRRTRMPKKEIKERFASVRLGRVVIQFGDWDKPATKRAAS